MIEVMEGPVREKATFYTCTGGEPHIPRGAAEPRRGKCFELSFQIGIDTALVSMRQVKGKIQRISGAFRAEMGRSAFLRGICRGVVWVPCPRE